MSAVDKTEECLLVHIITNKNGCGYIGKRAGVIIQHSAVLLFGSVTTMCSYTYWRVGRLSHGHAYSVIHFKCLQTFKRLDSKAFWIAYCVSGVVFYP